jgi:hypothetical protein
VSGTAQWLQENRENLARLYGVPVIPAGLTPQEVLDWVRENTEKEAGDG